MLKALRQVNGEAVGLPFSSTTTALLCGASGLTGCHAALDQALVDTAAALQTANGGSATPSSWTANSETQSGGAAPAPRPRRCGGHRRPAAAAAHGGLSRRSLCQDWPAKRGRRLRGASMSAVVHAEGRPRDWC